MDLAAVTALKIAYLPIVENYMRFKTRSICTGTIDRRILRTCSILECLISRERREDLRMVKNPLKNPLRLADARRDPRSPIETWS